jgi:prepilin-type N-terminal cleavage/methylation domain-containing protein/prepilin-type processing-associated H-X9-DG protein
MRCSLRRRAYTLIELLVVIALLAVLVGLILAAVQWARELASRADCGNRLRQAGLALTQFHDAFQVLPSNGGWDGKQTIPSTQGQAVTVSTTEPGHPPYHYGVGDPALSPTEQTGSWAYAILPYLEQALVFEQRRWMEPIRTYSCPSRRQPLAQVCPAADQYASYETGGWAWGKTDYAANAWVIANRPVCLRLSDIRDGLSRTIVLGEKAMDPANSLTGTWFWDEPVFIGGSGGTMRGESEVLRDAPGIQFQQNWGSAHGSGAQFLFADGSVRLIAFGTAVEVIVALRTPAGGEAVQDP